MWTLRRAMESSPARLAAPRSPLPSGTAHAARGRRTALALLGACWGAGCVYAPARTIPDPLPEVREWALAERPAGAYLGLGLRENDSGSLEDLSFAPGVRVVEVAPSSPAARAGFALDDVLLEADGQELLAPSDVDAILGASGDGARIVFEVQRGDTVFEVAVSVERAGADAPPVRPLHHLDPARSRAAWADGPAGGPGGAVLVARPDAGPVRDLPIGTVVTAVDEAPVLSGRGLVRELARRAPGSEVVLNAVPPGGEQRTYHVRLLSEGRVVTRASVPVLLTYDADLEADRRSFVLLDLWLISLLRYERDGNERRWRFLRFFEWSSGIGELGD